MLAKTLPRTGSGNVYVGGTMAPLGTSPVRDYTSMPMPLSPN